MNILQKRLIAAGLSSTMVVAAITQIIPYEGQNVNHSGEHISYVDMVGVATACWGLTGKDMYGNKIVPGTKYTQDECEKSLAEELTKFNATVNKSIKTEMKPYEEIAYTSLAWNIGQGAFSNSTLVKKHNSGDVVGACREILKWNRATFSPKSAQTQIKNGEHCSLKKDSNFSCTVKGLTNRRMHEYRVCIGEDSEVNSALQTINAGEKPSITLEKESEGVDMYGLEIEYPASYSAAIEVPTVPELGVCRWKFFNICLKRE